MVGLPLVSGSWSFGAGGALEPIEGVGERRREDGESQDESSWRSVMVRTICGMANMSTGALGRIEGEVETMM